MSIAFQEEKIHEGRNSKRIREILGLKQEALGQRCKSKFNQRRISEFENMWTIPEPTLQELADALGVTIEFIRSFSEEKAIYNIQNNNTFEVSENSFGLSNQPNVTYNNSSKVEALMKKLVEDDKVKTQAILDLTKVVSDLAEEVKKLKRH
ncbi:helix-turn-helix transcriptional regulator [Olivibacter sp. CPCC 100613]|uniref:helix-turn-helix domain-containing protein n=1 Tax=Olivibacter sp. CPCC 100613 TaxID=3079931 RepID=UPI002FFA43BE